MLFISALLLTVLVVGYVLASLFVKVASLAALLALGLVLEVCAVWAAIVDAQRRTIPNACCVAVVVAGLLFQLLRSATGLVGALLHPLACVGLALGVTLVFSVVEFSVRKRLGRTWLGFGDIKYIGAWTLVLGAFAAPALACACLAGALVALVRRKRDFAFGPWLSAFFVVALLLAVVGS